MKKTEDTPRAWLARGIAIGLRIARREKERHAAALKSMPVRVDNRENRDRMGARRATASIIEQKLRVAVGRARGHGPIGEA